MIYKLYLTIGTKQVVSTYEDEKKAVDGFLAAINYMLSIENEEMMDLGLYKQNEKGSWTTIGEFHGTC